MYQQVRRINTYKKIAFNFLFFVIILAGLVCYFIFYKVEIYITPVKEKISIDFLTEIKEGDYNAKSGDEIIKGEISSLEIDGDKDFVTSGEKELVTEISGKVFIINKESFNQPLVATTRLLTPDNVLFRIKDGIIVPANGEVEVDVYPDDENFKDIVKLTKFSIPGLSEKLQKTIYAESRRDLGKKKLIKILTQEDINVAREDLAEDLREKAKSQFDLKNKNKVNFNLIGRIPKIKEVGLKEVILSKSDKSVGSETEKFNLYLKIKAIEISFDENKISDLAEYKLKEAVPDDKSFVKINKDSFNYIVDKFNFDKKSAEIKVYASGEMVISEDSLFLNDNNLAGKTIDEAKEYLEKNSAIESVEIKVLLNCLKYIPKNLRKVKIIIQE
ncbi:hypothetical protein K8R61_00695 [bacterium]|nr:hypothetical protein [bacterium]